MYSRMCMYVNIYAHECTCILIFERADFGVFNEKVNWDAQTHWETDGQEIKRAYKQTYVVREVTMYIHTMKGAFQACI